MRLKALVLRGRFSESVWIIFLSKYVSIACPKTFVEVKNDKHKSMRRNIFILLILYLLTTIIVMF